MSYEESVSLPDGWELTTVDQLVRSGALAKPMDGNHGGIHPKASDYVEHGVPFVMASDLKGSRVDLSNCKFISEAQARSLRKGFAQSGDVLLSHKATIGRTAIVQESDYPFLMLTPQVTYYRVLDAEKLIPNYLKAYFDSHFFQSILTLWAGAGSTRAYLGITGQLKLPVIVPTLAFQKLVAAQAEALNDKIQLGYQINQTLEQIAQAIFKSWFVDFEPVKAKLAALEAGGSEEDALLAAMQAISGKDEAELTRLQAEQPEQYTELRATAELFPSAMQDSELGEIPKGWRVGHLSELIQFNPRRSLKKGALAPYLDMKNVPTSGHLAEDVVLREMNSGTKFVNGDTLLARITPCLENGKTAYVDFLDRDQVGWGSTEYIVMRSQHPYPGSISYFIARDMIFRQHAIQSMTGTSGRQRANAKALAELPWTIYPQVLAEAFNRIATPYLKLARSHGNESKSLSAIRDSLLPKLLSGELKITTVEA